MRCKRSFGSTAVVLILTACGGSGGETTTSAGSAVVGSDSAVQTTTAVGTQATTLPSTTDAPDDTVVVAGDVESSTTSSSVLATTTTTTTSTTSATTTLPTTTTTTTAPISDPLDLADWPTPGPDAQRRITPAYLPSVNVPETVDVLRARTGSSETDRVFETSLWVSGETGAVIQVTTRIPWAPTVAVETREPLDTSAWLTEWDEAFVSPTVSGITSLKMFDADVPGVFEIRSFGLSEQATIDIAAGARRVGPNETGWVLDEIPDGFIGFGPNNLFTSDILRIVWANGRGKAQAELMIATHPEPHLSAILYRPETATVDINGVPGFGGTDGEESVVLWEPEPGVYIAASAKAPLADTIEFARSAQRVDQDALNAATVEYFGDYLIGCTSMFC